MSEIANIKFPWLKVLDVAANSLNSMEGFHRINFPMLETVNFGIKFLIQKKMASPQSKTSER